MDAWAKALAVGRSQHGVVTKEQALAVGVAARTWHRRLRAERWDTPHAGVAVMPGAQTTFAQKAMAAVLAVGRDAVASHQTAAYLLGMIDQAPSRIDVTVTDRGGAPRLAGVRVHRPSGLGRRDRTRVGVVPTTSPVRTMCDIAGDLGSLELVRPVLIAAVQRRKLRLAAVIKAIDERGRFRGAALLRKAAWQLDEERCDSEFEYLVRRRLRAEGLPPARGTVPVRVEGGRVLYVDIGYPPLPVVVEVDGQDFHTDAADVARDHARQHALVAAGYVVLRITWLRFDTDWDGFCAELRQALRQAAAAAGMPYPV